MSVSIYAKQALLPGNDSPCPATVVVDSASGKITAVHSGESQPTSDAADVIRIDDNKILLPGLIDTHVHLNQPGRTEWEGFETGTSAAVSGGVTTLIDMPLNSLPPVTTVPNLEVKREAAVSTGVKCDVGFWGGILPTNAADLAPLIQAGVKGFKCFLINSGVDEFPHVQEEDVVRACEALEGTGALVIFHAELDDGSATGGCCGQEHKPDPNAYQTFLDSRPPKLETDALALVLRVARRFPDLRFHIVHLSAADALPAIRAARAGTDGGEPVKNLSVETCYHYLTLSAEDVPDAATEFKCCPPIRPAANRAQLVEALLNGEIDYVVSDHSPCTPQLKEGDFMGAWGGVSGLGFGLPLLWTELGQRASLGRIVRWLSAAQAKQVGLEGKKGEIKVGNDADFAVFDPEKEWTVDKSSLHFRNKVSAYAGKRLRGRVERTIVRGQVVYDVNDMSLLGEKHGVLL